MTLNDLNLNHQLHTHQHNVTLYLHLNHHIMSQVTIVMLVKYSSTTTTTCQSHGLYHSIKWTDSNTDIFQFHKSLINTRFYAWSTSSSYYTISMFANMYIFPSNASNLINCSFQLRPSLFNYMYSSYNREHFSMQSKVKHRWIICKMFTETWSCEKNSTDIARAWNV